MTLYRLPVAGGSAQLAYDRWRAQCRGLRDPHGRVLRADFALLAHHRAATPVRPLPCDLLFLHGVDDARVDAQGIEGWRACARGRLRIAAHLRSCLAAAAAAP